MYNSFITNILIGTIMSMWNKIKSMFGFGKTEVPFPTTVAATSESAPVPPVVEPTVVVELVPAVETTPATPTKKPRKVKVKKVAVVEESFESITDKFKSGLDKNRKSYFTKMVKEYNSATEENKASIKGKIEKYMIKNQ